MGSCVHSTIRQCVFLIKYGQADGRHTIPQSAALTAPFTQGSPQNGTSWSLPLHKINLLVNVSLVVFILGIHTGFITPRLFSHIARNFLFDKS